MVLNTPRTLALIPDGNRRWARAHMLSMLKGYDVGVKKFISFSEWCRSYGINNIIVWAFSTENFERNKKEINTLFSIYQHVANDKTIIERLHRNRTRFNIIGNLGMLPTGLRRSLEKVEERTKGYSERVINMLIGYGGREDILCAVNSVQSARGREVNESDFGKRLMSKSIPDIDFIIRTSGERRLSGFMPWQSNYAELYFSDKLWPDFTKHDLHNALADYNRRQRRFGR